MSRKIMVVAFVMILTSTITYAAVAVIPGINYTSGSPRVIAMGGAYVAIADDANAIFLNPAGLSVVNQNEVSINYGLLTGDVNQYALSGYFPGGLIGGIGAGYNRVGVYNIINPPAGTTNYFSDIITIACGLKIIDGLGLGLKVNRFSEQYDSLPLSANGYGMGIGFLFVPINWFRIGMLAENFLNTDYKYNNGATDKIYPNVLLGGSFQSRRNSPLFAGEINMHNIGSNQGIQSISLGSELTCFDNFKFRIGYLSSKDTDYKATGSAGFGINPIDILHFDYALQHTGERKTFSHYFSVANKF